MKLRLFSITLLVSLLAKTSTGEITPKNYTTNRISSHIKIDGVPNEFAWSMANVADNFIQLEPAEGKPASQVSEVRVLYDNTAIYISAVLFDTDPDSILKQLGSRDQSGDLNSDAFRFGLDPYNNRQSGYVFEVSASGVQSESFEDDLSFDAVWESNVSISEFGWSLEMKIPFSALRFPKKNEQVWAVQFARLIRRNREYDQWTLTPKNITNRMLYWGTMDGIREIEPPLRLSLTPYFSFYTERAPTEFNTEKKYEYSYLYSGGADIKYGIDERFTLDMTLLPDFSQVQSDNKVKNLSAFETIYEERRPFFMEANSLFSLGGLFYSRRIGKTPELFYSVNDALLDGEELEKNPDKVKLINATKLSGRTDRGLGIGVLNAITSNTYATVKNTSGERRKILTEPLTNFNLLVFDQQLKNNSGIYLVNSNVSRAGKGRDANVTKVQLKWENKKHQYRLRGQYSMSRIHQWVNDSSGYKNGSSMYFSADKIIGRSWYGISYDEVNKNYDKNDLSYQFVSDNSLLNGYYSYNLFNPFLGYFKQGSLTLFAYRNGKLSKGNEQLDASVGFNFFLLFNNNWSLYVEAGSQFVKGKDYYEPRIEGRYYQHPKSQSGSINFTTNYNRRLAFDFGSRISSIAHAEPNKNWGAYLTSRIRINDHLSFRIENQYDSYKKEIGFAYLTGNDSSLFGRRDIVTMVNAFSSNYLIRNDVSISCAIRHYWSNGKYDTYYLLNPSGDLDPIMVDDLNAGNFNSNYFTIDLVYSWRFAPGSSFLITYKNAVFDESDSGNRDYFHNLNEVLSIPQTNSISLKLLYYLDYQNLSLKKRVASQIEN